MTAAYDFDYPPSSPRELAFREENFQENAPRDFSKRSFSSAFINEVITKMMIGFIILHNL